MTFFVFPRKLLWPKNTSGLLSGGLSLWSIKPLQTQGYVVCRNSCLLQPIFWTMVFNVNGSPIDAQSLLRFTDASVSGGSRFVRPRWRHRIESSCPSRPTRPEITYEAFTSYPDGRIPFSLLFYSLFFFFTHTHILLQDWEGRKVTPPLSLSLSCSLTHTHTLSLSCSQIFSRPVFFNSGT